ncbi:MAG: hypothetical protein PVG65_07010 [Candidatus Thorarchaeota archaeon]|jgi:hypothetical protein
MKPKNPCKVCLVQACCSCDCDDFINFAIQLNKKFKEDLSTMKTRMLDLEFATNVYRALCNMQWKHVESGYTYGCTWRAAGGVVANIRGLGEKYTEFYCSGREGEVDLEVKYLLKEMGWVPKPYPNGGWL